MDALGGHFPFDRGIALRCLACALAFLALNLVHSAATVGLDLLRARDALRAALDSAARDDLPGTADGLSKGVSQARSARAELDDPSLRLAGLVPAVERELSGVRALAYAAESVGRSALRALGRGRGLDDLYRRGTVDLDALSDLTAGVRAAETSLHDAAERLERVEDVRLGPLARALRSTTAELRSAEDAAGRGADALGVLPAALGAEGRRRYLLAFQSPSEARGGGGLIGVVAILEARAGSLDLGDVTTIQEVNALAKGRRASAPGWFRDLYAELTALEDARQVNLSPSFPATADVLLDFYRRATGERLDGVIAVDPVTLGKMTRAIGRLHSPGWKVRIGARSARRVLLHDIYLRFGRALGRAQNTYLEGLISKVWDELRRGDLRRVALAQALLESIRTQHLKIHVRDPSVAEVLHDLGADGDPASAGPNVQVFFHNNFSGNKVDYFLFRRLDTRIGFESDGDAVVETEVTLSNRAPGDVVNLLTRALDKKLPTGFDRMTVHLMLPREAVPQRLELDGRTRDFYEGRDSGHPVMWDSLGIGAGETRTVTARYCLPRAAAVNDGDFELTLWPQATVRPDRFSVSLRPPDGVEVVAPRGAVRTDDGFVLEGVLKAPREIGFHLERVVSHGKSDCKRPHRNGFRSVQPAR